MKVTERRRRDRQALLARQGAEARPFAAVTDREGELLDSRPHLYPLWRALSRRLGAKGGAGEVKQRALIVTHYVKRGRAPSTYWRHRAELRALGLLVVEAAAAGPRFGPGARRRLILPLARLGRRPAEEPAAPPQTPVPPAAPVTVQAPRGPPAIPEEPADAFTGIRSGSEAIRAVRRSRISTTE